MSQHSSRGAAWEAVRLQVLQRDGYVCAYCSNQADTVDHIIPKAKGGTDVMSNLISACRSCNGTKQDRVDVRLNYRNPRYYK